MRFSKTKSKSSINRVNTRSWTILLNIIIFTTFAKVQTLRIILPWGCSRNNDITCITHSFCKWNCQRIHLNYQTNIFLSNPHRSALSTDRRGIFQIKVQALNSIRIIDLIGSLRKKKNPIELICNSRKDIAHIKIKLLRIAFCSLILIIIHC